jgi:hypothetical protein
MSPDAFEREFVRPARPVVLRGLVADWPARSWDFPRIASRLPKRPLRASGVSRADRLRVQTWEVSPDEIADRLSGGDREEDPDALRPDWLFDLMGDLPELIPECPPPDVYRGRIQYRLFMGRSTTTPGHYHSYQHAMICVIHGHKRVVLYPPGDSPRLYPYPLEGENRHYQSSQVDFAEPDGERFPKVTGAHPVATVLGPGDALFVPIHWWHAVYGVGSVMSTSLFWDARLRDYRFPHPGLTAIAGMLRWHAVQRLRTL